ncbi:MAG: IS630 family transposase, partial [Chitinivibrionales bacterium]|nr:IS630 family transposase [Chitinivibrionales bacterium]
MPVYVILDNLRVHHAIRVQEWVSKQRGQVQLFFLPAYSPEYNPDEYLNQDLKSAMSKKLRPTSADALKNNVQYHM